MNTTRTATLIRVLHIVVITELVVGWYALLTVVSLLAGAAVAVVVYLLAGAGGVAAVVGGTVYVTGFAVLWWRYGLDRAAVRGMYRRFQSAYRRVEQRAAAADIAPDTSEGGR